MHTEANDMKKCAGFVLVLAMLAAPAGAQAPTTAAIEKQLVANERAINEAVAKNDMKAFRALVAREAWSVDGTGVMPVAEFEKMLSAFKVTAWKIENPQVQWLSPDIALVTYKWTGTGTFQGQPLPSPSWASTLWAKQADGKWLAKFHQESMAMEMPAAKK
jgi:ketosteroid isomerase-like protein